MTSVSSLIDDGDGLPFEVIALSHHLGERVTVGWTNDSDGGELYARAQTDAGLGEPAVVARRPTSAWFLSFRGGSRNGAALVRAVDASSAVYLSWCLGLNPGGEVLLVRCPETPEATDVVHRLGLHRFITVPELLARVPCQPRTRRGERCGMSPQKAWPRNE